MKRFVLIFCLFASVAIACPDEYMKELKSEKDQLGWELKWFDVDCDNKCDGAILFSPNGEPIGVVSCEQADEAQRLVQEEINKNKVPEKNTKSSLKFEDI